MSHTGKSPRSALSERLLASNSPGEVAIDIPRPERSSNASAPGIQPDASLGMPRMQSKVPIRIGLVPTQPTVAASAMIRGLHGVQMLL